MSYDNPFQCIELDFTATGLSTKAKCQAAGLIFSDDDTPFPDMIIVTVSGTWTHSSGKGWVATPGADDQGPGLLLQLYRGHDWEFESILTYAPGAVGEKGSFKFATLTPSNHWGFHADILDNNAVASELSVSLVTNDGDDTGTSRYAGNLQAISGSTDWTLKFRNKNGCIQVYDDEDDAWNDYSGRQDAGRSYSPAFIAIQPTKVGAADFMTAYLKSLKLSYI